MEGNVVIKKTESQFKEKEGCFVTMDGRIFKVCKNTNQFGKKGQMKEVKQSVRNDGYLCFGLNGKLVLSHRFVWEAFFGEIPEGMQINHRDENKSNNNIKNLEMCDCAYNINYGTHNKRMAKTKSKQVNQYNMDGTLVATYPSANEAARQNGFHQGSISNCCNGKQKSAYGFVWRYSSETIL